MAAILLLNGPNLNLLGTREPEIYGATTLDEIVGDLRERCAADGVGFTALQSNAEHELIEAIHAAPQQQVGCIIFNPAAFTHTSVALRDALLAVGIAFIEVHLSAVNEREEFRQTNYFSDIATEVISGQGAAGYIAAFMRAKQLLENDHGHQES